MSAVPQSHGRIDRPIVPSNNFLWRFSTRGGYISCSCDCVIWMRVLHFVRNDRVLWENFDEYTRACVACFSRARRPASISEHIWQIISVARDSNCWTRWHHHQAIIVWVAQTSMCGPHTTRLNAHTPFTDTGRADTLGKSGTLISFASTFRRLPLL